MDLTRLIPFLQKQAALGLQVSPEEVAEELRKAEQSKQEDKQRETIDNEVVEQDENPSDDLKNEEGALLENSFKELAVEDAIEQAKETKLLVGGPEIGPIGNFKSASFWDLLAKKIK